MKPTEMTSKQLYMLVLEEGYPEYTLIDDTCRGRTKYYTMHHMILHAEDQSFYQITYYLHADNGVQVDRCSAIEVVPEEITTTVYRKKG